MNTVVWDFGHGNRLFAEFTATFSFADDFSRAGFAASGRVAGGEGRYDGASGWIRASGPVTFEELRLPHLVAAMPGGAGETHDQEGGST